MHQIYSNIITHSCIRNRLLILFPIHHRAYWSEDRSVNDQRKRFCPPRKLTPLDRWLILTSKVPNIWQTKVSNVPSMENWEHLKGLSLTLMLFNLFCKQLIHNVNIFVLQQKQLIEIKLIGRLIKWSLIKATRGKTWKGVN